MKNEAVFMTGINTFETREISLPQAGVGEVIVEIEHVGICGSDLHYLESGRIGDFIVEGDFILGHECAGTVVGLGDKVQNLKMGDRVALEPGQPCGACEFCRSGRYNLCPDVKFLATPPYHGALVRYLAYPENLCFKLPDSVSTIEGALVEPLAVGLQAVRQGQVHLGQRIAILGGGTIGLMTLLAAKAYGASSIYLVDVLEKRLELATRLGAIPVNASQVATVDQLLQETEGFGFDVVFETAGSDITIRETPYLVKRGGTIVLVGLASQNEINFDFMQIMTKEVQIQSVFRYCNLYPAAISAISSGQIQVNDLLSQTFPFSETAQAFKFAQENKKDVIKVMIALKED